MLKLGEGRPVPLQVDAGESGSKSGNSDCADNQCGEESEWSDSCDCSVKFSQSKKQNRRSRLEVIVLQAWEKQALGWHETSLCDAWLIDPNIGPVLGWCEANERPDWSAVRMLLPC